MKNQIQLCMYAERLGGNLKAPFKLLQGLLEVPFGGVHILPFFNPINHAEVAARA